MDATMVICMAAITLFVLIVAIAAIVQAALQKKILQEVRRLAKH